jgi:transposase
MKNIKEVRLLISVGVDVSKGKSTVCILKPYGEVIMSPNDYEHTLSDLKKLADQMDSFEDEIHVTMEATGNYHFPIATYLKKRDYDVRIINPLEMKRYRCQGIRNPKTDSIDAFTIAQYGIDFWFRPFQDYVVGDKRIELKTLGMQYFKTMKTRQDRYLVLESVIDRALPGIGGVLNGYDKSTGKDKKSDFVYDFYHAKKITVYSENRFCDRYESWSTKKGYRYSEKEARQLYSIAKDSIPTLPSSENTKLMVQDAVKILREVDATLHDILIRMNEIAKCLPEYTTVMDMKGVGVSIGPRLIAEIGDPRRFHSAKALIAFAGIDAPPYQSGKFTGTERHMSKRGSRVMRKIGFELMDTINKHQKLYAGDPVCEYFLAKRAEGKKYRVAMFAAYNKFLRIYHSRVSAVLNENVK